MRSLTTTLCGSRLAGALLVFSAAGLLLVSTPACDDDTAEAGFQCPEGHFCGQLQNFQTKTFLEGGECYLLYNVYHPDEEKHGEPVVAEDMPFGDDGERIENPVISGKDGLIVLNLDPEEMGDDRWGYRCTFGPAYRVTYQFNIRNQYTHMRDLWVIPNSMYRAAPALAGIDLDEELGVVAGRLVWYTKDDQGRDDEEHYVGCAEITMVTDESGDDPDENVDVRYMSGADMPVTLNDRVATNPANGLYIGANMPIGTVELHASVDDNFVGGERIFSTPGTVVISNIHVGEAFGGLTEQTFTADPTPADCR